ncbi:MAG: CGNR zinc finger domain-containing protein [Candidatus Eremiobacteraeota bacterium]|nr:CGNR zinc finger domain-containing protein [Candidatus Eremiobacteraeota bacterium]
MDRTLDLLNRSAPGSQPDPDARAIRQAVAGAATGNLNAANRLLKKLPIRYSFAAQGARLEPQRKLTEEEKRAFDAVLTLADEGVRKKLRLCEECGWAFIDKSRNGRTRFCSVSPCATRWHVREFRSRAKDQSTS